ncbi:Bax inhibitor-1/YccA family protein [Rothia sp. ZJ1223]|uniref:Bax inhibitor-1/YccA family protein n=1 Tax=Rothia sp. ZJ1223 TaxID=2811098 RepID=UPI00351BEF52
MAGNPLITSMGNQHKGDPRFGQFGAGGTSTAQYGQQSYGNAYGAPQYGQNPYAQNTYQQPNAEQLNQMYKAPAASNLEAGRVTMDDVVRKTGINLAVVVAAGAVAWFIPVLMYLGLVGGIVLGLVNAFKKKVSPALIVTYSLMQGLFLGGVSRLFDYAYPGIVVQAVGGTVVVAGTILVLFANKKLRTTPKLNKFFMIAASAYLVFLLINLVSTFVFQVSLYGANPYVGLAIALFAVLLASYSLLQDYTNVTEMVNAGAPKSESWRLAFALTASLVWLYIEILRVLSFLRQIADN